MRMHLSGTESYNLHSMEGKKTGFITLDILFHWLWGQKAITLTAERDKSFEWEQDWLNIFVFVLCKGMIFFFLSSFYFI